MTNREQRRAAAKAHVNPDPLTITWFSNAVWTNTGYSTQTRQAVTRLMADGHHVAVAANWGLQGMQTEYEGIQHFPMGYAPYSDDVVESYSKDWNRQHPDGRPITMVLFDAWPLTGPQWDRMPVAILCMVDHVPIPPKVRGFCEKPNVTPIAVSRFGEDQFGRAEIDCLYVPLAIDTGIYKPTASWSNGEKDLPGWKLMGWDDDDAFTVTIANANKGVPGRKAWGENLLAFSIFAERHDDARLYIHTERHGNVGGMPLDPIIASVGLKEHQYRFVNQYAQHMGIPNEAMAALYTATDVLLAATYSEGFGLTPLEAQSCGTPVIVNDFTAQPELLGDGWLTTNQVWWDAPQASYWAVPNVMSIVEGLEAAYARGKGRSDKAMAFAAGYDADLVYDTYWRPALAALAQADPAPAP